MDAVGQRVDRPAATHGFVFRASLRKAPSTSRHRMRSIRCARISPRRLFSWRLGWSARRPWRRRWNRRLPAAILRTGGRLFAANDLMQRLMPESCATCARITLVDTAADACWPRRRAHPARLTAGAAVSSFALRATERQAMVVHVLPVAAPHMTFSPPPMHPADHAGERRGADFSCCRPSSDAGGEPHRPGHRQGETVRRSRPAAFQHRRSQLKGVMARPAPAARPNLRCCSRAATGRTRPQGKPP